MDGRDRLLHPDLVRLIMAVDELEEESLTELKLMPLPAGFCLALLEKRQVGRDWKTDTGCRVLLISS